MIIKQLFKTKRFFYTFAMFSLLFFYACGDGDEIPLKTSSFDYSLHNGQVVPSAPYNGIHSNDVTATLKLDELENGKTNITVTIQNTIEGVTYHTHAHDAADASSTPNGTPYNESPNTMLFAQAINGTGGTVTASQEASMSYNELISTYEGFFVIHDPLQAISTVDIGTFLVVGSFSRAQSESNLASSTFQYDFNMGQLVSTFAYEGTHPNSLSASITVDELADNRSRVIVTLINTLDGETYHTHAHDAADPANTPNGTPYNEAPNSDVFIAPIIGNGGTTAVALISPKSRNEIISQYEGFFVVHDPLQAVSTVDPTTYVILGSFAR